MTAMRRFLSLLTLVAVLAVSAPAGAQDIRINPVPPGAKPKWTKVPGTPEVSWAPNLPTDVFRYRGKYYFFWENYFYQGRAPQGPWKVVGKVPEVFYDINPAYFKTAKKTGAAPESPAEPAETVVPRAKIIDLAPEPPAPPATPAPPAPEPALPVSPEPPAPDPPAPKVM
jgi:hypothetical protein